MAAGATSSIGRPRRAAISSGRFSPLSAATVACTTLIALEEPSDRDSTSCTPAHSSTARTGPPAMTPVPGLAGLSNTTPAAASPCTVCGIVPPMRGTRKKCFLAASTPLAMAAGTSLAFPYPTPTMPLPSPTTTRAVKLNRRPPWTTLATRLMVTTRSRYAVPLSAPPRRSSRRSRRSPPPPRRGAAITFSLQCWAGGSQRQPAFAGTVGECGHPAVVGVASPVEDGGGDPRRAGAAGQQLADLMRPGLLIALRGPYVRIQGRRRCERVARAVVHQLGEDVPGGPVHGQPRPGRAAGDLLAHAQMAPRPRGRAGAGLPAPSALGDSHVLLSSLPDLAADLLAGVTHALALVRIGLAELADVRGDLADLLLVDPLHDDPGGGLHAQGDAIRRGDRHRVAVAERELHPAALGLHPVSDTDDLQRLAVPVGHAGHHVGDQATRQAVQRPDPALIVGPGHGDDAVGKVDLDGLGDLKRQRALGPLDGHRAAIDRDIDALRYHHREPSDS